MASGRGAPDPDGDGGLRRVMLLVSDETERVKLERAAKEKDDAHRKEVLELPEFHM